MTKNLINWQELTGNKFLTKFHPAMLAENGYAKERTQAINRRNRETEKVYVVFNRDYVIQVLKAHFELLEIDVDDAIDLVGDVFQSIESERSAQEIVDHETMYRDER